MQTVIPLLRQSRLRIILAVVAGAISGLGTAGLIAIINTALGLPRDKATHLLVPFIVLCLLVFAARTASEALLVRLSQHMIAQLRGRLSRQILASPLRQLEQHGTHRLLAALTEDVQKVATLLTRLPTFCINGAVALGCFAYLGWLSPPLMLAALASVGLAIGGFALVQVRAQQSLHHSRIAGDDLYKSFTALTEGCKELQMHEPRREAFLSQWLDDAIARVRRHFVAGMTTYAFAEGMGLSIFFAFIGALIFLPTTRISSDAAVLTGFALTFLYLISPIEVLVNLAPDFAQFRVALRQLAELELRLAPPRAAASVHRDPWGPVTQVALHGACHAYRRDDEDGSFQLGPIDMELRAGELLFITGGNGTGKTTLAKLLVGLYAPDDGHWSVNGERVETEAQESYRQLFSAIFSDFYLFEELLGLAEPGLQQKAEDLLRLLRLDHKVKIVDGRFSTIALSQGQRKRLALIAAVLEDRPVCLFDEWAADQDPVFKRVFYTEILPWLRDSGKAVAVVTHDDAYFGMADQHLKLESGRVIDFPEADLARPVTPVSPILENIR